MSTQFTFFFLLAITTWAIFGCTQDQRVSPSTPELTELRQLSPERLHEQLLFNQRTGNDVERRRLLLAFVEQRPQLGKSPYWSTLHLARHAYETLAFEQALVLGRKAATSLKGRGDSIALLNVALLLGRLHYEHWQFSDSVSYFSHLADQLLTPITPKALIAEAYLLRTFRYRTVYTWGEIETTANQGLRFLRDELPYACDLSAQLYLMRGIAIRKQRLGEKGERLKALYRRSKASLDSALIQYEKGESPRIREALAEIALHQTILGDDTEYERAVATLVRPANHPYPQRFGYPARFRAYRAEYYTEESYVPYYEELLTTLPAFNFPLVDEARNTLEDAAKQSGEYQRLWQLAISDTYNPRCGAEVNIPPLALPAAIAQTKVCLNNLCDLAVAKLLEYESSGSPEALRIANAYFSHLLEHWGQSINTEQRAAILYQLNSFGKEVMDRSIQTGYYLHREDPMAFTAEDFFRRLEATKGLLLRRALGTTDAPLVKKIDDLRDSMSLLDTEINVITGLIDGLGKGTNSQLLKQRDRLRLRRANYSEQPSWQASNEQLRLLPEIPPLPTSALGQETIIEYSATDFGLYAVVLSAQSRKVFRLDTAGLNNRASALRNLLQDTNRPTAKDIRKYVTLSTSLYEQLFAPLRASIPEGIPILIVPDGDLRNLPLEALLENEPAHQDFRKWPYLIRQWPFRFAPSWTVDHLLTKKRTPLPDSLNVRTLVHDKLNFLFQDLHQQLQKSATTYYEHSGSISEKKLDRFLQEADLLQLSCHAVGHPNRPRASHLFLSQTDSISATYLEERVINARLVVMAACETQVGRAIAFR